MVLLHCKDYTLLELSQRKSQFPPAVRSGLLEALQSIDEAEAATALGKPEHSNDNLDELIFQRLRRQLPADLSIDRKDHVSSGTRFENDFTIRGPDFAISVEVEKGDRARLDLDVRKMEAFSRETTHAAFGVFLVPLNNRLDRSISGNTRESSFDYVRRTLRLSLNTSAERSAPVVSPRERIGEALELLKQGLEPFIDREMRKAHGKDWKTVIRNVEPNWQFRNSLDAYALLKIMISSWNQVFKDVLSQKDRSLAHELLEVRNQWAHQGTFSFDDAYRALDSAQRLLLSIKSMDLANKLGNEKNDLLRLRQDDEKYSQLVDVLVIGYPDPTVRDTRRIRSAPLEQSRNRTSAIVNATERLSFDEVTKVLGSHCGYIAKGSSTLHLLRQIVHRGVPTLTEKVNPNGYYLGYRGSGSDRAYVYVQPDKLVIDILRPRTIKPVLSKLGIKILHRNNFQGRAGWTTGINLLHNAPSVEIRLVADQIIQALAG